MLGEGNCAQILQTYFNEGGAVMAIKEHKLSEIEKGLHEIEILTGMPPHEGLVNMAPVLTINEQEAKYDDGNGITKNNAGFLYVNREVSFACGVMETFSPMNGVSLKKLCDTQ